MNVRLRIGLQPCIAVGYHDILPKGDASRSPPPRAFGRYEYLRVLVMLKLVYVMVFFIAATAFARAEGERCIRGVLWPLVV